MVTSGSFSAFGTLQKILDAIKAAKADGQTMAYVKNRRGVVWLSIELIENKNAIYLDKQGRNVAQCAIRSIQNRKG